MARLTTEFWISAYLRRLRMADIAVYVTAKGDATAGTVLVKLALLDGTARAFQRVAGEWAVLVEGDEREVDAAISRQRNFDPDLWVIEVEDRQGRHLLDEEGLA